MFKNKGESLIELLLVMGLMAILAPALITGLVAGRSGKPQEKQRFGAVAYTKEADDAIRVIRESGWSNISTNGTYHPATVSGNWTLAPGSETANGYTRQIVISDAYRDVSGNIALSGTIDPSTKKITTTVSWTLPYASSTSSIFYLTRSTNSSYLQTSQAEFNTGILTNTETANVSGGEVTIAHNNKAKWCSPSFSTSTIDLPDGPPVAVAARANATDTNIQNDVMVATSPNSSNSIKLAYLNVTANSDPPVTTQRGTFTLDSGQYSNTAYVPTGIGIDNNFRTNNVKYYTAPSGRLYALLATDRADKEVIAILVNDGNDNSNFEFQDPFNHIYKYWTFFNTRQYQGDSRSTPNQDETPFGYGANALAVYGTRGYVASGGYLYVFDLSTIDSKTPTNGLDMIGCRIEINGFSCKPQSPTPPITPIPDLKYSAGQTGAAWGQTAGAAHPSTCFDGGNVELYADDDIYPVQVGGSTYIYVAVGAGTGEEFEIVNATTIPTNSTNPRINANACGTIGSANSGWRRTTNSLDFNPNGGSEEAANSVFATADGTRAYISSNGGIDSKQLYILNTTNKNSPSFLSSTGNNPPTPTPPNLPASGFYNAAGANGELYPHRSLTVLNGQRAVLVGKDGITNANDAWEYQVLDNTNEAAPAYCGGINFDQGFNDLTSVSEADGDNFVYMVANTTVNELKIIQGGPDGTYVATGTYDSAAFDPGYNVTYNRFVPNTVVPANTSVQFQIAIAPPGSSGCSNATYVFTGPDGTVNTYYSTTAAQIRIANAGGFTNPGRCMKYRAYMSTTDYNSTSQVLDVHINYSP